MHYGFCLITLPCKQRLSVVSGQCKTGSVMATGPITERMSGARLVDLITATLLNAGSWAYSVAPEQVLLVVKGADLYAVGQDAQNGAINCSTTDPCACSSIIRENRNGCLPLHISAIMKQSFATQLCVRLDG